MAEQHAKHRDYAPRPVTRRFGYQRRWCKKCERRTFHWLDDADAFTRRQCDECGTRSGMEVLFWVKRFAVPIAIGVTLALVTMEPARRLLQL